LIRTLEFWRAIIAECIATFFYVLMLSSVHQALNHPKDSIATVQLYSAVTAGLAAATLTHAFLQVCCMLILQNPAVKRRAGLASATTTHAFLQVCCMLILKNPSLQRRAGLAAATLTHAFLQVCCMSILQEHHHCPALEHRHRRAGSSHPHPRLPPGMLHAKTPKSSVTPHIKKISASENVSPYDLIKRHFTTVLRPSENAKRY
jgi:hypothetical protein